MTTDGLFPTPRHRAGRHERNVNDAIRAAGWDTLDKATATVLRALARQLDVLEASPKESAGTAAYVGRELRETLRAARLTRDTRTDTGNNALDDLISGLHESIRLGESD